MHILVELSEKNQKVDPKQILVQLFDEKLKLYQDIQLVLHIASYAPTKSIIDSVIESIVSSYECLSDQSQKNQYQSHISIILWCHN